MDEKLKEALQILRETCIKYETCIGCPLIVNNEGCFFDFYFPYNLNKDGSITK